MSQLDKMSATNLQCIFAGGLEEDAGEELGAGLHLEPLLDLLALAGEAVEKISYENFGQTFQTDRINVWYSYRWNTHHIQTDGIPILS